MFLIAFPGLIISKNDNMRSFISKLFVQFDPSKIYMVPETRVQDTLSSGIVDQEDPGLHEPAVPGKK